MANANIDALYAGSLRITISYFFPRNVTFYKWCVTKVAHCICYDQMVYVSIKDYMPPLNWTRRKEKYNLLIEL